MEKLLKEHIQDDDKFHHRISVVLYGDHETGEMGMKDKVDAMYKILVQVDNVKGFFGGLGTFFKWLLILGALIALLKGWLVGLLTYLLPK